MAKIFNPDVIKLTKYLFFTGKGGVGKTSAACATALTLADDGKRIMLVSADPVSNLQDVFDTELDNKGATIEGVPNLTVVNFHPEKAAEEYKESVVESYRGKFPEAGINNLEEQLSDSCMVEIEVFNEFSNLVMDNKVQKKFDHIIFDTAPTSHTLRMLKLCSAWRSSIDENINEAPGFGQLAGLESRKEIYKSAIETLADKDMTTLILVSRPERSQLTEAEQVSKELKNIGLNNQILLINGVLQNHDDQLSESIYKQQQDTIREMPANIKTLEQYEIPLRPYNITGLDNIRALFKEENTCFCYEELNIKRIPVLNDVVKDLYNSRKKIIFIMGKGGVGKTSIAGAIALGLANMGKKVHLATTDPAANFKLVLGDCYGITLSNIDVKAELEKYKEKVLGKAKKVMNDDDIEYIKEDLRSPYTQEIAVFSAFADIVDKLEKEIVIVDTAPTGHALLLLESTQKYNMEIQRTQGDMPESVSRLLSKLRNPDETEVVITTLAEPASVYEAERLEYDLNRAGIKSKWWVINSSLYAGNPRNMILKIKANNEIAWINKVDEISRGNFALVEWKPGDIKGEKLIDLLRLTK
ncbi:MAG: arsenical pump-driving ATPase [Clostridiaceae bacterium]